MLFHKIFDALLGAWEEPGVVGTRVEIDAKTVQILWQGGVVLDTPYTAKAEDDRIVLLLKKTGMRYAGAGSDYAAVTALYYADGTLVFRERFPITGESECRLKKTENSRYGNYDVADDEYLPLLQGVWRDDSGFYQLRVVRDVLTCDGRGVRIRILRGRGACGNGCVQIVDADPAKHGLLHFCNVRFADGEITAMLPVCDAPSCLYRFKRE